MELHQLRYFLAIAERGTFTAAAEACHVSQPSLSAQVAKLEDELGGPLFDRSRQGAKLTQRGELFRPRAAEALHQLELATLELADLDGLKRGSVALGSLPTTGTYLLPPVLTAFRQAHPGISIQLREESSPRLAEALLAAEVELTLLDEAGLAEGMTAEKLFTEPLYAAVPPGHRFAGRASLALADLADEPLILMKSGHGFRKIIVDAFHQLGLEPRVVSESGSIETIQALVEAGLGLTLVPRLVRKKNGPVYLPVTAPSPTRTLYLAHRKNQPLSPAAEALRQLFQSVWGGQPV